MPDGPGKFTQDYSCPALLRIPLPMTWLRVRAYHPLRTNFPERSARHDKWTPRSYNPGEAVTSPVWAVPRSLATTGGITVVFFSYGY